MRALYVGNTFRVSNTHWTLPGGIKHMVAGELKVMFFLVGRGQKSHAYTHSVQFSHHVFLNLHTLKFYCLPDNYEIIDSSLEDITVSGAVLYFHKEYFLTIFWNNTTVHQLHLFNWYVKLCNWWLYFSAFQLIHTLSVKIVCIGFWKKSTLVDLYI